MDFDDPIRPIAPIAPIRPLRPVRIPDSVKGMLLKGEKARLDAIRRRRSWSAKPIAEAPPEIEHSEGQDRLEETLEAYEQAAFRLLHRPPDIR